MRKKENKNTKKTLCPLIIWSEFFAYLKQWSEWRMKGTETGSGTTWKENQKLEPTINDSWHNKDLGFW